MKGFAISVGLALLAHGCVATPAARRSSAVAAQNPYEALGEPATATEVEPAPFLSNGCLSGENDVSTWKRIAPSDVTDDQQSSLNYSPCTWAVTMHGSQVIASRDDESKPAEPPGFVLPKSWGRLRVVVRGESGILFGFNNGEWGGALLWYSSDGRFQRALLRDNIVDILPRGGSFIVFTGLTHLGGDHGHAIELIDTGTAFRVGRSVDLGTAPRAMIAETNGTILIAATHSLLRLTPTTLHFVQLLSTHWGMFYPTSIVVNHDPTAYIGMRGIVAEVRLGAEPPSETWLLAAELPK